MLRLGVSVSNYRARARLYWRYVKSVVSRNLFPKIKCSSTSLFFVVARDLDYVLAGNNILSFL